MNSILRYDNFFSAEDVATFRRLKKGSMKIASVAREVAADMVGGSVPSRGREYVETHNGVYRLAMSENSDNTTESSAHRRAGVVSIVMGNAHEMSDFFSAHGLDGDEAFEDFLLEIRSRIWRSG